MPMVMVLDCYTSVRTGGTGMVSTACAWSDALPLFPLPGTVFFPHTLLPLHVFEPRYRQMTEHVLATHQHLAVVLLPDEGAPDEIARTAGLGRIVHHEKLPDGRFHILLQGVGRVRLLEELPPDGLLYRRARAIALPDDEPAGDPAVEHELALLRACYARLVDAVPDTTDSLGDLPHRISEPGVLSDIVNAAVLEDPRHRQRALEETSVVRRLKCANDALATLLLRSLVTETACVH
jgi:uncharacterized protein